MATTVDQVGARYTLETHAHLEAVKEERRPVGRLVVQLVVEAQVVVVGERRALRRVRGGGVSARIVRDEKAVSKCILNCTDYIYSYYSTL